MWTRWMPWRWIVSRLARSKGFVDPISILSRLHRFAQPSEVTEPIELLRAGVIFHARGLINARAIQHNLDWVWPYWVERQFNPCDVAFVPRAFSITHVNLTHRNWTAVGLPDLDWLPIVDPRGLITPIFDGWSVDAWVILNDGRRLLPSRADEADHRYALNDPLAVTTRVEGDGAWLESRVDMDDGSAQPTCRMRFRAGADTAGLLALALRPANPEGVSFIHEIAAEDDGRRLRVNDEDTLSIEPRPQRVCMACYRQGDVLQDLSEQTARASMRCDVGLATAAAIFPFSANETREVVATLPQPAAKHGESRQRPVARPQAWPEALNGYCRLRVPDARMQFLYDAAVRSLVLHSPGEVYPGPYTYKRFWFRDAAFILEALLALGLFDRVERCIDRFGDRQTGRGYYLSQEGEWDSNGAALWIMGRYRDVTGRAIPDAWVAGIRRGAAWIAHKRLRDDLDKPHAGLLPAGFSAEHLGPNDFYFWDDFWSIAGLRSAAALLEEAGHADRATTARNEAEALSRAVDRAIEARAHQRPRSGVPASPYRRMDAGAIGSIAAGYPLRLWDEADRRLIDTAEFLLEHCMVRGGFFQDMIHSGVNAYLTLHLAQVLLRAGEAERAFELVRAVADLASPTGQWPEAIHPATGGGCMGDGQHIWAAAEWVLMMRALFVREEGDRLVLASGLPRAWLRTGARLELGPAPTRFGTITVRVEVDGDEGERVHVSWEATWRRPPETIEVRAPGGSPAVVAADGSGSVCITAATAPAESAQ